MRIKCFVFDLGGVCFSNGTNAAIETYWSCYGIHKQLASQALCGRDGTLVRMGLISTLEFWKRAKLIMETDVPWQELQMIWDSSYELDFDVMNLINELRRQKMRILFLSDNTESRMQYLENKYSILSYFDGGIFSFIENKRKPDICLYRKILTLANCSAKECVYIDDNKDFLVPAEILGMNTLHFISYPYLIMSLEKLDRSDNR